MRDISKELAHKLNVIGPINFQYAVKDGKIYCIEANPRGSRTLPFLSKAYHMDLPGLATDAMLGVSIQEWHRETNNFFSVKQSTFPFDRFIQDNIILGPKMRSTGETMGIDSDKDAAILKSYLGNYPGLRAPGKILISLADQDKPMLLPYLKQLRSLGLEFYATKGTCDYIRKQGITAHMVSRIDESGINMLDVIKMDDLRVVFNTPGRHGSSKSDGEYIRNIAIQYGIACFTRKENIRALIESLLGCYEKEQCQLNPLAIQDAYAKGTTSPNINQRDVHA
jgi:carbamoyl-phosphate synthase large subunit